MTRMSPGPHNGPDTAGAPGGRSIDPFAEAAQLLDVHAEEHPGGTVVRIVGEVDITTSPLLRSRIDEHFDTRPSVLVLDLSRVGFLASSGLAVLVEARRRAQAEGTRLQLLADSRVVLRPLSATGLLELFEVVTDVSSVESGP